MHFLAWAEVYHWRICLYLISLRFGWGMVVLSVMNMSLMPYKTRYISGHFSRYKTARWRLGKIDFLIVRSWRFISLHSHDVIWGWGFDSSHKNRRRTSSRYCITLSRVQVIQCWIDRLIWIFPWRARPSSWYCIFCLIFVRRTTFWVNSWSRALFWVSF